VEDQLFKGISSANATVLDPAGLFLKSDKQLLVVDGGKDLYFDDHHLSVAGAMRLRPLFEPVFAAALQKKE
jgi:hypothetical protein